MEDRDEYRHKPLGFHEDLRILNLLPKSKGERLRGKIKVLGTASHTSFDDGHTYDVLSYSQSSLNPACFITLENGKSLRITKNCSDALHHLRRSKRSYRLWVDAVCLDQSETESAKEERSRYISRMGHFLSISRRVIVWLGVSDYETGRLFAELWHYGRLAANNREADVDPIALQSSNESPPRNRTSQHFPFIGITRRSSGSVETQDSARMEWPRLDRNGNQSRHQTPIVPEIVLYPSNAPTPAYSEPFDGTIIPSLITLLRRPYFARLWTLQEVALARQCLVLCGNYALSIDTFASGILFVKSWINAQKTSEDISWLQPFQSFLDLRLKCKRLRDLRDSDSNRISTRLRDVKVSSTNQAELLPLLWTLREQRTTRPGDKIHAVYSLMDLYMGFSDIKFPPVNYKQLIAHCYVNATLTWMVYCGRPLEILKMVSSSWHHTRLSELPSWVPDWSDCDAPRLASPQQNFDSSLSANERYALIRHDHGFVMIAASSPKPPKVISSKRHSSGHPRLYVNAKVVGRVSRRSYRVMHDDYLPPSDADNPTVRELEDSHRARCLLDWFRFINPKHTDVYEPTGEQMLTALYSVLLGFSALDAKQDLYSPRTLLSLFDSNLLDNAPIDPAKAAIHASLINSSNRGTMSLAEAMCPRPAPPTYLHLYLTNEGKADAIQFIRGVTANARENSLFETDNFFLGSANERLATGDIVALLEGGDMPFILRERKRKHEYSVIGPAYVHGLMYGEEWRSANRLKRVSLV